MSFHPRPAGKQQSRRTNFIIVLDPRKWAWNTTELSPWFPLKWTINCWHSIPLEGSNKRGFTVPLTQLPHVNCHSIPDLLGGCWECGWLTIQSTAWLLLSSRSGMEWQLTCGSWVRGTVNPLLLLPSNGMECQQLIVHFKGNQGDSSVVFHAHFRSFRSSYILRWYRIIVYIPCTWCAFWFVGWISFFGYWRR